MSYDPKLVALYYAIEFDLAKIEECLNKLNDFYLLRVYLSREEAN